MASADGSDMVAGGIGGEAAEALVVAGAVADDYPTSIMATSAFWSPGVATSTFWSPGVLVLQRPLTDGWDDADLQAMAMILWSSREANVICYELWRDQHWQQNQRWLRRWRRQRRRRHLQLTRLWVGSQAIAPAAPPAAPPPDVFDEVWERRLRKRRACVLTIRSTPEYRATVDLLRMGAISAEQLPLEPNPEDTSVSKRQWELAVKRWRACLKEIMHGYVVRMIMPLTRERQTDEVELELTIDASAVTTGSAVTEAVVEEHMGFRR